MLALTRREGETILVYPSLDVDPQMTVAELFKDGPIRIGIDKIKATQAKVLIQAPKTLEIVREEIAPIASADPEPIHHFWP